jgi:hypothetical protein
MNGLNVPSRTCLTLAAGAALLPGLAGAQVTPPEKTYIVTTLAGSAGGNVAMREVISLARDGTGSRLRVVGGDASSPWIPVRLTAQGEIASDSQDGAITCYNMAMQVLAHTRQPDGEPASIFVRFGASVVDIPLTLRATQTQGEVRSISLDGRSSGLYSDGNAAVAAGIILDASVETDAGDVRAATFDERNYAGTPARVISRSTCILQRTERQPATQT